MRTPVHAVALSIALLSAPARQATSAAEEWEAILDRALKAEHSQTRQDGVKQIDTSSLKGLKALWAVLAIRDPHRVDWYVREGAYEALSNASGEEAEKEISRVLKETRATSTAGGGAGAAAGAGYDGERAKEAIIYSIIWRVRKAIVKARSGNDERKRAEELYKLRKARGVEYFAMVLPIIKTLDPEKKHLGWIQQALADRSTRVRRAALTGLVTYPDHSSIPLLIDNLRKMEKQKAKLYREWVLTRGALETLTGEYFRDSIEDWARWWDIWQNKFTIEKRVEEEKSKEGKGSLKGRTMVARKDGIEVHVDVKVAGPAEANKGYPLLVIPWRGYEVDYFRPYFHGVEEFCRVYYVRMPQIDDFKGLARDEKSNLARYPTKVLSAALVDIMHQVGLERFAVLAHGPDASVLAMMLAADHPARASHLVLINPRSAGRAYEGAIENVRREGLRAGSKEITKGADNLLLVDGKPKYSPSDSAEHEGVQRAINNLRYADPTEPETGAMFYLHGVPSATKLMADDTWSSRQIFQGKRTDFPVLVFIGEKAPWTPISDVNQVVGLFKNATVVKMAQSSEMPFVSETHLFTKSLEDFLRPAILAEEKAKAKEKAKESKQEKTKGKSTIKKE